MKAVCIVSGGMDSMTLLYDLYNRGVEVYALSLFYGQRHAIELQSAEKLCAEWGIPWQMVDLSDVKKVLTGSSQTDDSVAVPHGHYAADNMKATVVPNRNMILLSIALGYAVSLKADAVFYAAHGGDHCLPASTPVFTKGGWIPISDVQEGNEVLSTDSKGKQSWKKVQFVVEKGTPNEVLQITTCSGATFRCTSEHKVFVVTRERCNPRYAEGYVKTLAMKKAKDLTLDDILLTPANPLDNGSAGLPETIDLLKPDLNKFGDGSLTRIEKIETIANEETVWDITVEDNHNFYCGDTLPVLVSNSIYPDCRDEFVDALSAAAQLADWHQVQILGPYTKISKADIAAIGTKLGLPYEKTFTCYKGRDVHCGLCATCVERREAFYIIGEQDPTTYAVELHESFVVGRVQYDLARFERYQALGTHGWPDSMNDYAASVPPAYRYQLSRPEFDGVRRTALDDD